MNDTSQAVATTEAKPPPAKAPAANKMHARDIQIGRNGINFTNAAEVMAFANMMADSDLAVPKHLRGNPGACLAVIDDAIRHGMSPYALARESYATTAKDGTVNLAYMAKAVAGIIIKRGPFRKRPTLRFEGADDALKCFVTFYFDDGTDVQHESPEIGKIKPKNSPLWFSDPRQQLGYYTLRSGGRLHCPDVLMGLYDLDEMGVDSPLGLARPAPTITQALPGPDDNAEHVDAAAIVYGDGAVIARGEGGHDNRTGADGEGEGEITANNGFTDDDRALIAEIVEAIAGAKTNKALDVIANDYREALSHASAGVADSIAEKIAAARDALANKRKKPEAEPKLV